MAYLNDADLQIDDLSESVDWNEFDLEELEDKVYATFEINGNELDILMNEFSVDTLNF